MSTIRCSFCGKGPDAVSVMIAGPSDVAICSECTFLCVDILLQRLKEDRLTEQFPHSSVSEAPCTADEESRDAALPSVSAPSHGQD